jgi:transcriptional regulator with XRE-family HTH domain
MSHGRQTQVPVSEKFCEFMSHYRVRRKMSMGDLARASGYDISMISRTERGERAPSYPFVLAVADALRLDDSERDALLVSAGFSTDAMRDEMAMDPLVRVIGRILNDDAIPMSTRSSLRLTLAHLADLALQARDVAAD